MKPNKMRMDDLYKNPEQSSRNHIFSDFLDGQHYHMFGYYDPKVVGASIDFDGINRKCVNAINALGFNITEMPVREGSDEEMTHIKGKYKEDDDVILLARRYYRPGSEPSETADSYDYEFILDHQFHSESLWTDHLARLTHMCEDIVAHEYGHKVCRENYREQIVDEAAQSVFSDFYSCELARLEAVLYSSDVEEGFVRWLNYVVVGHEHPSDIKDLSMFSSQELRAKGVRTYHDGKAVADFYRLLKETSDQHSVAYVVQNFPIIALQFMDETHQRQEKEIEERIARMGFDKYFIEPSPNKETTDQ